MSSNEHLREFHHHLVSRYPRDGDQMSISQWIQENTHLKGRKFAFKGYEFQRQIADDMHPQLSVIKPSQIGLALALDTPVPTPNGWTTMGAVQVGDVLFDEKGAPCTVQYVSPVYRDRDCYRLTFCDGETVVADADHKWVTWTLNALKEFDRQNKTKTSPFPTNWTDWNSKTGSLRGWSKEELGIVKQKRKEGQTAQQIGLLLGRSTQAVKQQWNKSQIDTRGVGPSVVTTLDIHRSTFVRNNTANHVIPLAQPLQLDPKPLPIPPWCLGYLLGNGYTKRGGMCACHPKDLEYLIQRFESFGFSVTPHGEGHFYVRGVLSKWRELGMEENKHIPLPYLRSSYKDRVSLLQGLIDSDGSVSANGSYTFCNTNVLIVQATQELALSLGCRVVAHKPKQRTRKGSICKPSYTLNIHSPEPLATIQSKLDRARHKWNRRQGSRRILSVEKVDTVPVRCIQVDSPNHLFLCGRGMIPTHNTEVQVRKALTFAARNRGTTTIFTLPNEKMYKRMSKTRVAPLVQSEKAFKSFTGEQASQAVDLYNIAGSWVYFTGMTEGEATSIAADVLYHDELDLSDQQNIGLYQSRIQGSKVRITQSFSTPTLPHYGIDARYAASDQHEYMCVCDACNHWQVPTFDLKHVHLEGYHGDEKLAEMTVDQIGPIDFDRSFVKCERCSAPLDILNPEKRQWVSKFPSRRTRGYRVRPFCTESLLIEYIVRQLIEMRTLENIKGWYNTVLGEPFADGNSQLMDDQIARCLKSPQQTDPIRSAPCAISIDVGQVCHVIVGRIVGEVVHPVLFLTVPVKELVETVKQICSGWNIVCGAIDRHPYTPTAEAVFHASGKKVIPVEYRGSQYVNIKKDELGEVAHAQVNRTSVIDRVAGLVRRAQMEMSGYGGQREVIISHLKDMVRVESTETEARWEKITGEDHYFHSLALLQVAPRIREVIVSMAAEPEDERTMIDFYGVDDVPNSNSLLNYRTAPQQSWSLL